MFVTGKSVFQKFQSFFSSCLSFRHDLWKRSTFDWENDFLFSPLFGEMIQFWLIFFRWVETTNQSNIHLNWFALVHREIWRWVGTSVATVGARVEESCRRGVLISVPFVWMSSMGILVRFLLFQMGGPHHELPWNVSHLAKSQKGKVKHIRYSQLWSLDHDWAIILMLKPQKRKKTSSKIFLSYHSKDRNKNDSFFFVFFLLEVGHGWKLPWFRHLSTGKD